MKISIAEKEKSHSQLNKKVKKKITVMFPQRGKLSRQNKGVLAEKSCKVRLHEKNEIK